MAVIDPEPILQSLIATLRIAGLVAMWLSIAGGVLAAVVIAVAMYCFIRELD